MKSGPDVFADALVPTCRRAALGAWRFRSPNILQCRSWRGRACRRAGIAQQARCSGVRDLRQWLSLCRNAQGKPNSVRPHEIACSTGTFFDFARLGAGRRAFTSDSSRYLNCPSNLIGHDHPNKPANGDGDNRTFRQLDRGRARGEGGQKEKGETRMFQGHIDLDTATPVEASAIPDVLFERGLYWASGRSGVVNLVAAHKWFNLAALKGRTDAIPCVARSPR